LILVHEVLHAALICKNCTIKLAGLNLENDRVANGLAALKTVSGYLVGSGEDLLE
jgi:hypothetical protein